MSNIFAPFQLLELNVISAQDLAPVARSMRTYAVAWVHPDRKLSTRVDTQGHNNPTWNDKFVFRVDEEFLHEDTSALMVEIYALHWFKDIHVGTVRVLVGNLNPPPTSKPHYNTRPPMGMRFVALQVRRPSGRPQGILNVGVAVLDSSMRSMPLYSQLDSSAVGYRHLMGEEDAYESHYHMSPPQIFGKKPELRRTKSDTSTMIGSEVTPKGRRGKASSVLSASEVSVKEQMRKKTKTKKKGRRSRASSLIGGSEIDYDLEFFDKPISILSASEVGKILRQSSSVDYGTSNPPQRKMSGTSMVLPQSPSSSSKTRVSDEPPSENVVFDEMVNEEYPMQKGVKDDHMVDPNPILYEMDSSPKVNYNHNHNHNKGGRGHGASSRRVTPLHNMAGQGTIYGGSKRGTPLHNLASQSHLVGSRRGTPLHNALLRARGSRMATPLHNNNYNNNNNNVNVNMSSHHSGSRMATPLHNGTSHRGSRMATPFHNMAGQGYRGSRMTTPLHRLSGKYSDGTPMKSNLMGGVYMTESELGPSPSEVAAALAKAPKDDHDKECSLVDGMSLDRGSVEGLESKLERWQTKLPPIYDMGEQSSYPTSASETLPRSKKGSEGGSSGLFSCFSNICGCQCSIVCGSGDAKKGKSGKGGSGKMRRSPSVDLSFL